MTIGISPVCVHSVKEITKKAHLLTSCISVGLITSNRGTSNDFFSALNFSIKSRKLKQGKMNTETLEQAREYDSISSVYFQNRVRDEALRWIGFDENDDVLDVGCGPGRLCKMLSPLVNSVTGLDISPGMIEYAKMEYSGPNIRFFQEDAKTFGPHLTHWRDRFHKILSMTALHWCFDKKSVLENVYQCLKSGGLFLLDFETQWHISGEWSRYGETCEQWLHKHHKWGQHLEKCDYELFPVESTDIFLDLMRSVGFIIEKSEVKQSPWVQWNEIEIKTQIRCTFHPIKYIPVEHYDEFIDDVYKWICNATPKKSGNLYQGELGEIEHMTIMATKE